MPLNSVHRSLTRIGAHIVYLRDFRKFYYLAGISSLGSDYAASVEALDKLIHDRLHADLVHCIGNSAGVYGALQMGLDLGARSVLCLAGPTRLTRSDVAERLARQMPEIIARTPAMLDVRSRYDFASTRPRVRLLYGNEIRATANTVKGSPDWRGSSSCRYPGGSAITSRRLASNGESSKPISIGC